VTSLLVRALVIGAVSVATVAARPAGFEHRFLDTLNDRR
jgi:hypothetical protein